MFSIEIRTFVQTGKKFGMEVVFKVLGYVLTPYPGPGMGSQKGAQGALFFLKIYKIQVTPNLGFTFLNPKSWPGAVVTHFKEEFIKSKATWLGWTHPNLTPGP